MSEQNGVDAPQPSVDTVGEERVESAPDQAEARSVAYDEFQKVVMQRQEEKKARRALEARLEEIENAKAQEQGQWKELFEKRDSQYKQLEQSWLKDKVQLGVSKALQEAGCIDDELALAAGKGDLLEFDSQSGSLSGVDAWLEDVRDRKPHLFQPARTPTINPAVPGGGARRTAGMVKTDFSSMSVEELKQQAKMLDKQMKG